VPQRGVGHELRRGDGGGAVCTREHTQRRCVGQRRHDDGRGHDRDGTASVTELTVGSLAPAHDDARREQREGVVVARCDADDLVGQAANELRRVVRRRAGSAAAHLPERVVAERVHAAEVGEHERVLRAGGDSDDVALHTATSGTDDGMRVGQRARHRSVCIPRRATAIGRRQRKERQHNDDNDDNDDNTNNQSDVHALTRSPQSRRA
jgi:hypothetical protein